MTRMKQRRLIYYTLMIIFFFIFSWSGLKVVKILSELKSTKNNFIYSNKSNVYYDLEIADNEYIKKPDLSSYETYINALVKSINMNMKYKYSGSEKLPINLKYKVTATIFGLYNHSVTEASVNPKMWKKEYVLMPLIEKKYNNKDFAIDEKFRLDWQDYNQEVWKFKESLSLPTTAYLEVKMVVEFNGENEKYTLNENREIVAKMNLSEQVFSIDTIKENIEEKVVPSNDIKEINREQRKLTAYVVLAGLVFILILITIKQILNSKDSQPFHEEIDIIKKDYDEIVVETKNMVEIDGLNQVSIANFQEMLNLSDSMMLPIMLYETKRKAIFYIIKNDMIYLYIKTNKNHK